MLQLLANFDQSLDMKTLLVVGCYLGTGTLLLLLEKTMLLQRILPPT